MNDRLQQLREQLKRCRGMLEMLKKGTDQKEMKKLQKQIEPLEKEINELERMYARKRIWGEEYDKGDLTIIPPPENKKEHRTQKNRGNPK